VQSYKASAEISRACGYSEMTDHRFLTPDSLESVPRVNLHQAVLAGLATDTATAILPAWTIR
jgi:hypothetical protein